MARNRIVTQEMLDGWFSNLKAKRTIQQGIGDMAFVVLDKFTITFRDYSYEIKIVDQSPEIQGSIIGKKYAHRIRRMIPPPSKVLPNDGTQYVDPWMATVHAIQVITMDFTDHVTDRARKGEDPHKLI